MAERAGNKNKKQAPRSGKRTSQGKESPVPRWTSILIVFVSASMALAAVFLFQEDSNGAKNSGRKQKVQPEQSHAVNTPPAPPVGNRLFSVSPTDRRFTIEELRAHGPMADEIYLAIFGRVYDVTKGRRHYGKKGSYSFFAGRDATRSFVSGDFSDAGLTDDLTGLTPDLMLGIEDWVRTYEKDYKYVGILIGRFYNADGSATEALLDAERRIAEGHANKAKEDNLKQLFPPCNSRWSEGQSKVWCTTKSGGIQRDWVGVPRRFFKVGGKGSRCACVKNFGKGSDGSDKGGNRGDLDDPRLKLYTGCPVNSDTCNVVEE